MAIHVQRNVFFPPRKTSNENFSSTSSWEPKLLFLKNDGFIHRLCESPNPQFNKAIVFPSVEYKGGSFQLFYTILPHLLSRTDLYVSVRTSLPWGRHLCFRAGERKKTLQDIVAQKNQITSSHQIPAVLWNEKQRICPSYVLVVLGFCLCYN